MSSPGIYVANFIDDSLDTEYCTDGLDDAFAYCLAMGPAPRVVPPLGPTGPLSERRAEMYRHNRKLAERRGVHCAGGTFVIGSQARGSASKWPDVSS